MRHTYIFYFAGLLHDMGNELIVKELVRLGLEGIVPSHGAILSLLKQNRVMSMSTMAELIHRTKSTVTVLVRKLEKQGYVERIPNAEDHRGVLVRLTDKGCGAMPGVTAVSEKLAQLVADRLSPGEARQLETLLQKFTGVDLPVKPEN